MSEKSKSLRMKASDESHKQHPIPGTKLIQKVGNTIQKTQTNVTNVAKHTQANIKSASASATAMIEKTINTSKRGSSTDSPEKSRNESLKKTKNVMGKDDNNVPNANSERNELLTPSTASLRSRPSRIDTAKPDSPITTTNSQAVPLVKEQASVNVKESMSLMEAMQPAKLLHDPSMIALILASLLAAYKGIGNHADIWDNTVPAHVAVTWATLALLVGLEIGRRQATRELRELLHLQSNIVQKERTAADIDTTPIHETTNKPTDEHQGRFPRHPIRNMMNHVQRHIPNPFWTTLGRDPGRQRQRWERSGNVLVSQSMTKALKDKTPSERKKTLALLGKSDEELQAAKEDDNGLFMGTGTIDDPERLLAKSLEDEAVEPLCRLRGMDVFLTDSHESDLGTHSFLIENGLRDRPTFIINILTQWGNVAIYFELPDWVQSWDAITVNDDDGEDVTALKVSRLKPQGVLVFLSFI